MIIQKKSDYQYVLICEDTKDFDALEMSRARYGWKVYEFTPKLDVTLKIPPPKVALANAGRRLSHIADN
jgi:hypothetical protein